MKIYDINGTELINPDLSKGYVIEEQRKTGEHSELMEGTEGLGTDEKGLFRVVSDYETVGVYHESETSAVESLNDRISDLESMIDTLTMMLLESNEDDLTNRLEAVESTLDVIAMNELENNTEARLTSIEETLDAMIIGELGEE